MYGIQIASLLGMKPRIYSVGSSFAVIGSLILLNACSSLTNGSDLSGKEIVPNGPTVLNVHSNPSTVELTHNFQPVQKPEVLADVKDFGSNIAKVTLRFNHIPIQ